MVPAPKLLTVHGVGRSGDWQSSVAEVLGHYFDCVQIRYPQYQTNPVSAVLKVVIEPWALAVAFLSALCLLVRVLWLHLAASPTTEPSFFRSWLTILPLLSLALFFALGVMLAWRRREQAVAEVRKQIEHATIGGREAHLIAHSLGTYLTCRTLRTVQGLKLKRVIYVGSVVKRRFSWDSLTGRRIEALRNEVGGQDGVVVLAGFAKWLVWDLGWAGWLGFKGSADGIHSSKESDLPCARCSIQPHPAPVHNSSCPFDAHNTLFLSGFHAARFWLPFLWEYDPGYFLAFLDRCQSLQTMGAADFVDAFNRLRYASWGGRFCFEELVVREIKARLRMAPDENPDANDVADVLLRTWKLIVEAQQAMEKIERARDSENRKLVLPVLSPELQSALQNYDPRAAVWCAVAVVFPVQMQTGKGAQSSDSPEPSRPPTSPASPNDGPYLTPPTGPQ